MLVACGDDEAASRLTSGKELFAHFCAPCHRETGDGSFLRGVPPIKDSGLSYRELVDHIKGQERREDTRMPVFDNLTREQAEAIAVYLRGRL